MDSELNRHVRLKRRRERDQSRESASALLADAERTDELAGSALVERLAVMGTFDPDRLAADADAGPDVLRLLGERLASRGDGPEAILSDTHRIDALVGILERDGIDGLTRTRRAIEPHYDTPLQRVLDAFVLRNDLPVEDRDEDELLASLSVLRGRRRRWRGRDCPARSRSRRAASAYQRANRWNQGARLAHLSSGPSNLAAAVDLVARATVQRTKDGRLVTNQQELVRCSGLGEPLRNSDPQIAAAVNIAASEGAEIAFADPPGAHLGRPLTAGMRTPDGADAARFWKIERGNAEHTVRARFEVPKQHGYVVGDIELAGRPIEFGGQVADRVQVWIKIVVKPGNHKPTPKGCGT